ncbi:MAG: thiamine pyrophosphate-binding protein, partial [Terriglobales bacterium]
MKVSDYVARYLAAQGVKQVYEVAGGMITRLVDSIYTQGEIKLVSMHHEQAAAFAAEVSGRMTRVPGVAMATSGPGAINLLTGAGSAYFDSAPAIYITGQVNTDELKGERDIRQLGFQEADIVSMSRPIMKGVWQILTAEQVPGVLSEAHQLSLSGRPGPVLIDIPMDIQRAEIDVPAPEKETIPQGSIVDDSDIDALLAALRKASRPLILVGGGIRASGAVELFRRLAARVGIPVVYSLMAVDVLPSNNPLRVGLIGTYGNRWANLALSQADFLLVLGSRLDIRQTGADPQAFKGERQIYHVDCHAAEINNRVNGCVSIVGHLYEFLRQALEKCEKQSFDSRNDWLNCIESLKRKYPDTAELNY